MYQSVSWDFYQTLNCLDNSITLSIDKIKHNNSYVDKSQPWLCKYDINVIRST